MALAAVEVLTQIIPTIPRREATCSCPKCGGHQAPLAPRINRTPRPKVARAEGMESVAGMPRATHWNPNCSCVFSCLPDDVMVMGVFPHLNAKEIALQSATCTRWFALLTDSYLWEKPDLSARTIQRLARTPFDDVLSRILQKHGFPMMHELRLCGRRDVTVRSLALIGAQARNLRELHLCFIKDTTDEVVLGVARHCRVLEKLSLRGCSAVTDKSISYLFRTRPNLSWVMLQGCAQLTDAAFESAPRALHNLCLNGCKRLTDRTLELLSEQCAQLAKLNLNNVAFSDAGIASLVRGCPLISLHLGSADRLPDRATNGRDAAFRVTDRTLESLAAHAPALEELNMRGAQLITNEGVRVLLQRTPKLHLLHLGGCTQITDLILPRPTTSLSLHDCSLDHVDLGFTSITDATVRRLAALPRIRLLGLQGCARLTAACLPCFADRSGGGGGGSKSGDKNLNRNLSGNRDGGGNDSGDSFDGNFSDGIFRNDFGDGGGDRGPDGGFPALEQLNVAMCDRELCRRVRGVLKTRQRPCRVKGFLFSHADAAS